MSGKPVSVVVKGFAGYVLALAVVAVGTMYLFEHGLKWNLFLAAPASSLLSVGVATLVRRRLERAAAVPPTPAEK